MKIRIFYIGLIITLFSGCSKKEVIDLDISLEVDGRTVIKEMINKTSRNNNFKNHEETKDIIDLVCMYAKFLGSTNKIEKVGRVERYESVSKRLSINPVSSNLPIICKSGKQHDSHPGCYPAPIGSEQPQYHLELLALMKNQYGMKNSAKWSYRKIEINGEFLLDEIRIDNGFYQCSSIFEGYRIEK